MESNLKINIIGGGVIGCIQAIELKKLGHHVTIFEKDRIGSGSSMYGAGILFPLLPNYYSFEVFDLIDKSKKYYLKLSEIINSKFDVDIEYFRSGMTVVLDDLRDIESWLRENKLSFSTEKFRSFKAITIDDVYQINPKKLIIGLQKYLDYLGVEILENNLISTDLKDNFIDANGKKISGDKFILASGAWTQDLDDDMRGKIYPVRGQLIEYINTNNIQLDHILFKDGFYLLQRKNGSLIAGSTLENVGFDDNLTDLDLDLLKKNAEEIIPELCELEVINHWCGFRPGSDENIPIIIQDRKIKEKFYNVGHYRYGISMAPASVKKLISLF
jgi:glycine oxidase